MAIGIGLIFVVTNVLFFVAAWAGLIDPWVGVSWIDLPVVWKFAAIWVPLSGIMLWWWMFMDWYSFWHKKYRRLVGVSLFFGVHIAAMFYFLSAYIPRELKTMQGQKGKNSNKRLQNDAATPRA